MDGVEDFVVEDVDSYEGPVTYGVLGLLDEPCDASVLVEDDDAVLAGVACGCSA